MESELEPRQFFSTALFCIYIKSKCLKNDKDMAFTFGRQCGEGRDSHRWTNDYSTRSSVLLDVTRVDRHLSDWGRTIGRCSRNAGKKESSGGWPGRPHSRP